MKAIIITADQKQFYDKKFDSFNGIEPVELVSGEYAIIPAEEILTMLQDYAENETYPQSVRESARLTKLELESFELREITEADLKVAELPEGI